MAVPPEPPPWLAAQLKDPWGGEEAREFWNGVQQARTEAGVYRAAIASSEEARALKELYPGGVAEARARGPKERRIFVGVPMGTAVCPLLALLPAEKTRRGGCVAPAFRSGLFAHYPAGSASTVQQP